MRGTAKDVRVIYIAGMSHSGSTVLNLMLNAHPEIFAVGELIDLNRGAGGNSHPPCPCGAPSLLECEFWSRVNDWTQQEQGLALSELDVLNDRKLDDRSAPNAVVFRAISKISGKKFIVNSSKRPARLAYLMQLKGLDVFPIHLIREPNGQISSLSRKNGGFVQHICDYVHIHERIHRIVRSSSHSVVSYEGLVRDPMGTLSSILEPLGLQFDQAQLSWAEQRQHTIAGNKLRWQPNDLILDERWKESLTPTQQFIIGLGTAYTRRWLTSFSSQGGH